MSAPEGSRLVRPGFITEHSIRDAQRASAGRSGPPSLHIVVGVDRESAGMCAVALTPQGGRYATARSLIAQRWRDHPQTVEELVWITVRGLQEWLREAGEILPEE